MTDVDGERETALERLTRDVEPLPDHVAVIQDGNRRYARERGEPPTEGHVYGAETTEAFLGWMCDLGIPEVTLYTLSTENFDRPDHELRRLFDLIEDKLHELARDEDIHDNEVKVVGVGEIEMLPPRVREALDHVESSTERYTEHRLNVAVAYGGRSELLSAARAVLREVERGRLKASDVDEAALSRHIYVEDVDLVIRTGGDRRMSNFLPWQAAGNEAVVEFQSCYWPEFTERHLARALERYADVQMRSTEAESRKAESPAD
ncbi:MAG: polyprenyl diphosphate synthase [Halobacteriales archaeon]